MSKREALILRHMPLVTFVVNRLSTDRTNTLGLERDDAIGFGTEGLIQAIDGFDETRGTKFASYAIFGNIVMLCQGADAETSLERCGLLANALVPGE